ncbi:MAG: sulfotransferase domain-containing protein [Deltaproteobacteria bacterium]|nr:sulfotransferase domain-containing protein [Deltaproteobacteria bacterium]MBL7218282.1 sulfotransferase domain-containing protein [Desulfobacteraceae bacterium]
MKNLPLEEKGKIGFLIAGTQKGGTTALSAYLKTHPEICMAQRKEVHFFDNETYFRTREVDYSNYHSFFNPKPCHLLLGEATPIYMYWRDAPKRIWVYNPNIKIIILLRNPGERAFSHWNMERRRNADSYTFWDAIQRTQGRCREALPYQHRVYSYIDRGFYAEQLRNIWRYFKKERVLVLKTDELQQQPNRTLRRVCSFLEVGNIQNFKPGNIHSTTYVSFMTKREKEYLKGVFEYDIKELECMLGWDCSEWLD